MKENNQLTRSLGRSLVRKRRASVSRQVIKDEQMRKEAFKGGSERNQERDVSHVFV